VRFSGSKASAWGPAGNATVTTGPRKTAVELSDPPFNNPLRVNNRVTTAPRKQPLSKRFAEASRWTALSKEVLGAFAKEPRP
jgi:hypothetical protein